MSEAPFTESEKARIRTQLSYTNWANTGYAIQFGVPAASQIALVLENSFDRLLPEARPLARQYLQRAECTEAQIFDAQERMKASAIGELRMNPAEVDGLKKNLNLWRTRLADELGCPFDPFSQMQGSGLLDGGINGTVYR